MADRKVWGVLAQFETTKAVYDAAEAVRDAGYSKWDTHAPFPIHGIDKAMGLKPSRLPWLVLFMGLCGASGAMFLQWWMSTEWYPLIISGKPYFAFQAYTPITFELGILLGSFGAVFGMFFFNRLPQLYHPVFNSDRFAAATDDKFFISIEAADPNYDERETKKLLEGLGASHVEILED